MSEEVAETAAVPRRSTIMSFFHNPFAPVLNDQVIVANGDEYTSKPTFMTLQDLEQSTSAAEASAEAQARESRSSSDQAMREETPSPSTDATTEAAAIAAAAVVASTPPSTVLVENSTNEVNFMPKMMTEEEEEEREATPLLPVAIEKEETLSSIQDLHLTSPAPPLAAMTAMTTPVQSLNEAPVNQAEVVASIAGWTAKRMSLTGEIFFIRDSDGRKQSEIPIIPPSAGAHHEGGEYPNEDDEDFELIDSLERRTTAASSVSLAIVAPAPQPLPLSAATAQEPKTRERPEPLTQEMITRIRRVEGNSRCCDCGVSQPVWASLGYGVLVCLPCSGFHRGLGTHITTVKSLELDNLTRTQYEYMLQGGNAKFKARASEGRQFARYKTEQAEEYRLELKQLVEPQARRAEQQQQQQQSNIAPLTKPGDKKSVAQAKREARDSQVCMVCGKDFTVRVRKYLCWNCNKACCASCAPALNSKPLPQLGLGTKPMRHCSRCYRSPFIDWSQQGLSAEGRRSIAAQSRRSVHNASKVNKSKLAAAAAAAAAVTSTNAHLSISSSTNSLLQQQRGEDGDTQSDVEASPSLGPRRKTLSSAIGKLIGRGGQQ